jgi:heavy metal sensor kinase
MSIRARLTFWFTCLFGITILALAVTSYVEVRRQAYSRLDSTLQVATGATAMSAEHELKEQATQLEGEQDLQSVLDQTGSPDLVDTQILVKTQNRNAAHKAALHGRSILSLPPDQMKNGATVGEFRIASRALRIPKFNATYEIFAALPVASAAEQVSRLRGLLLIMIPVGLALASLGGYLLAGRSLKPLKEFAGIVDAVTSSDLTARVNVGTEGDEISRLGARFNALLDRLEQAFALQRRFMADASHQIRTPITVALTAAQVGVRDLRANPVDLHEALSTIEKQMLQLRRIVEDMFFLSQSDTAPMKIQAREIYLDDAVTDAARAATALARNKGQTLSWAGLPEARCLGDADLLTQAVLNLLDNAIKFTPNGGTISVAISRRGRDWVCSVSDNGCGIPSEDQERIFQRFFRASENKKGTARGAGLGLAIAQSIAESHRGSLMLSESRPGRTVFEMIIPALDEHTLPELNQANSSAVKI